MNEDNDNSIFGDLEDQCTCWVCFEIFKDPVTLHCCHSFCKECAMKVYKKNPTCPFCRRSFELPLPDINRDVEAIVARYRQKAAQKDSQMEERPLIDQDAFILQLPDEVILDILSYLPPKQIGKTSRVCKDLSRLGEDGWLWRELCQNAYPFCSVDKYGNNWKHCFIGRSSIHKGWEGGKAGDFEVVSLRGHKNYVNCFRLYRNNIVSGSADNTVKIWKVDSTDPINTLVGHNGVINCVEFNETRVVSGSADCSLKIWDTKSGLPIKTVNHAASVNCLRFDDNKIISGGNDNSVKVWDVRQGTSIMNLNAHYQAVTSLEMDDKRVLSCGADAIKVWDLRTGNMERQLAGNYSKFRVIGNEVVAAQNDGDLKIWNITNDLTSSFSGPRHYQYIHDLQSDGKNIVSACADGSLKVWDLSRKCNVFTLNDHKGAVHTVQISGNRIVSGGADNSLKVWDVKKGNRLYTLLGGSLQQRSNNPNHPTKPGCAHLEFDDSRIVAGFASLVRVYDFETYKAPN